MSRILCVGHAVEDHVFNMDALPTHGRKYQSTSFEIIGGGPAANAAVAIARLGGEAMLAARIGGDAIGGSIKRDLEQENVDCALVKAFTGATSSVSAVLVDKDGERMIINHRPENLPNSADWLVDAFPRNTDAVLADVRWPQGAIAAFAQGKAIGAPTILDADAPIPEDKALLEAADIAAFSADGLREFTGIGDLKHALIAADEQLSAICCVTCGADGVLVAQEGAIDHVPGFAANAVDTTGAGDIWHGAFALAIGQGAPLKDAAHYANACAALKVARPGGRKGAPTAEEVAAFLDKETQQEIA